MSFTRSTHRLLILCCTMLALASGSARAASEADFAAAHEEFKRALTHDSSAIDIAASHLSAMSASEPGDPVLRAYAGAATVLRAETTIMPWRKLAFADDGLAQIDKALSQLSEQHNTARYRHIPAALEVRFLAASTFLDMPKRFHRSERGTQLLDDVLKSPLMTQAPLAFRAAVWLRAGEAEQAGGHAAQARQWRQKVVDSGAPQAAQAQHELKGMTP